MGRECDDLERHSVDYPSSSMVPNLDLPVLQNCYKKAPCPTLFVLSNIQTAVSQPFRGLGKKGSSNSVTNTKIAWFVKFSKILDSLL